MHVEGRCITLFAIDRNKGRGGRINFVYKRRRRERRDIGGTGMDIRNCKGVVVTSRDVLPARSLAKGRKQL